jgi:hypothetical protein
MSFIIEDKNILKGFLDCSTNPNYPAASIGDEYKVIIAGKIGGASGVDVHVGDIVTCSETNDGGDESTVGTYFFITEGNQQPSLPLTGGILSGDVIFIDTYGLKNQSLNNLISYDGISSVSVGNEFDNTDILGAYIIIGDLTTTSNIVLQSGGAITFESPSGFTFTSGAPIQFNVGYAFFGSYSTPIEYFQVYANNELHLSGGSSKYFICGADKILAYNGTNTFLLIDDNEFNFYSPSIGVSFSINSSGLYLDCGTTTFQVSDSVIEKNFSGGGYLNISTGQLYWSNGTSTSIQFDNFAEIYADSISFISDEISIGSPTGAIDLKGNVLINDGLSATYLLKQIQFLNYGI